MKIKNIVLTPEMEKKLKSSLGFKLVDNYKYVPKAYREKNEKGEFVFPKEIWPVFILKGIDGRQALEFEDELLGEIDINSSNFNTFKIKQGRITFLTCKCGIISWSNFFDETGEEIVYSPDKISSLRPELLHELCNAIGERSILTEEELMGLE